MIQEQHFLSRCGSLCSGAVRSSLHCHELCSQGLVFWRARHNMHDVKVYWGMGQFKDKIDYYHDYIFPRAPAQWEHTSTNYWHTIHVKVKISSLDYIGYLGYLGSWQSSHMYPCSSRLFSNHLSVWRLIVSITIWFDRLLWGPRRDELLPWPLLTSFSFNIFKM